jgi:hypothetical protein
VNENIFWLKVSVHKVFAVDILEAEDYLSCIKPGSVKAERLHFLNMFAELPSIYILHAHIDGPTVLGKSLKANDAWMPKFLLKRQLIVDMVNLLGAYNCLLRGFLLP